MVPQVDRVILVMFQAPSLCVGGPGGLRLRLIVICHIAALEKDRHLCIPVFQFPCWGG